MVKNNFKNKNNAYSDIVITLKTVHVTAGKNFHCNFLDNIMFSNNVKGEVRISQLVESYTLQTMALKNHCEKNGSQLFLKDCKRKENIKDIIPGLIVSILCACIW